MHLSSEPLGVLARDAQGCESFLDVFKPTLSTSEEACTRDGYLWVSGLCFRVPLYQVIAVRKIETNISCDGRKLYLVIAELGDVNRDLWEPEVVEDE